VKAWTETPVGNLVETVETNLANTAQSVSGVISGIITPLVTTCFGIYLILLVVNHMRGASSNPVWEIWHRVFGFAIIVGIGLNMGNYSNYVIPIITSFGDDIAAAASGGGAGNGPAAQLDALLQHYMKIMGDDWKRIQGLGFWDGADSLTEPIIWWMKSSIIFVGLVPFIVFAAALLILAKVGVILVAAVGPLFFACLVFPATRQYFSSWVNAAVSYALIPIFVAILAMFSVNISMGMFGAQNGTVSFEKTSYMDCFFAGVINLLLIVLLKTAQSLASQLSAGGINIGFSAGGAIDSAKRGYQNMKSAGANIAKGAKAVDAGISKAAVGIGRAMSKILGGNSIKPG
jgi:type IV secretion system protein VirB6